MCHTFVDAKQILQKIACTPFSLLWHSWDAREVREHGTRWLNSGTSQPCSSSFEFLARSASCVCHKWRGGRWDPRLHRLLEAPISCFSCHAQWTHQCLVPAWNDEYHGFATCAPDTISGTHWCHVAATAHQSTNPALFACKRGTHDRSHGIASHIQAQNQISYSPYMISICHVVLHAECPIMLFWVNA